MSDNLYHAFVFTPVNADYHIAELLQAGKNEDDYQIESMIAGDFDKIYEFQDNYKEMQFFILIRDTDDKKLDARIHSLIAEYSAAGMLPTQLNKLDLYNYISYIFENTLITDYTFSRGLFSASNMNYVRDENGNLILDDKTEKFEKFAIDQSDIPTNTFSIINNKSKLAPTGLLIKNDYYILGDKYVCNLLVTQLPKTFYLGLLCNYVNNPKVKLLMTTSRLDFNISAMLKKDYKDKEQKLRNTRDPHFFGYNTK